jgi:hypothetical protein
MLGALTQLDAGPQDLLECGVRSVALALYWNRETRRFLENEALFNEEISIDPKSIIASNYLRPCNFWYFGQFLTFGGLSGIMYCNNLMILAFWVLITVLI